MSDSELAAAIAQMRATLLRIESDVAELRKVVVLGNGRESLVVQVARSQESIESLEERTEGIEESLHEVQRDEREQRKEKLKLWGAALTGLLALAGTIVQAFL